MKIASFDIGIKNMAYCIFYINPTLENSFVKNAGLVESADARGVPGITGDILPSNVIAVVDWNVVDLLDTTNQTTQNAVCGCLLHSTKTKRKGNNEPLSKSCGKKAKYYKENAETQTIDYFCEKHAKNETKYLLPSKEYTLAHLRKQKVDGIMELYERFVFVKNAGHEVVGIRGITGDGLPSKGISQKPQQEDQTNHVKKYPTKPVMVDSIMKYYTSRLFSVIPIEKKNANDANLIQIGWAIRRIFDSSPHFSNITHVVIENQISPIASRMKTIQGMLAQYFIMKSTLEHPVEIVFVSSSNKLRLGEPATITETKKPNITKKTKESTKESNETKSTNTNNEINEIESLNIPMENQLVENPKPITMNPNYKQHKKDGVVLCCRFIESNIELSNWSNVMNATKKDDLADCFLQGVWFLTNRNIITCAENLKINIV